MRAVSFLKKKNRFFFELIFFILRNNHILTKVIPYSESRLKKGNAALDIFLDYADVSSYLRFNIDCIIR